VKAGVDPTGAGHCHDAVWGPEVRINQDDGVVQLSSPQVTVRPLPDATEADEAEVEVEEEDNEDMEEREEEAPQGRVTLCFFAEPVYPHVNNAAFFDQAKLIVSHPR
jgi:hypothetical protein